MKEEKHSDQIIKDKLENYSSDPPVHIWTGIQDQLLKYKRSRRIVIVRWISAAAAILIAFLGGWYFNNSKPEAKSEIAGMEEVVSPVVKDSEKNINELENNILPVAPEENLITSKENIEKEEKNTEIKVVASNKPEAKILVASSENKTRTFIKELEFLERRKTRLNSTINSANPALKFNRSFSTVDKLSDYDRDLIDSNSNSTQPTNQDESNWKLGMMVSPGYSSQVANHTESYASNMSSTAKNGNTNVTGGISIQVKTGSRLSVESGIYFDKNGQKSEPSFQLFSMSKRSDDLYAYEASEDNFTNNANIIDGNVAMNSNAGIIALDNIPNGVEIAGNIESSFSAATNAIVTQGDVSQVFDFIQIPLYLRYKVIDTHFDIEMIGGINAGMLVGNNAYIENRNGIQNIGSTKDISPLSFSGTIGVGLNYKLGNRFSLAAEPRFNYSLSSINKSSDVSYKPYRIGFYTGIYYEF